jgi:hypothetical protein
MPIPSRRSDEKPKDFMSRCMGDPVMNKEYPDQSQRSAVCTSKACEGLTHIESMDFQIKAPDSYEEGQMQREQLNKMHDQLMEIVEYMEGVVFQDWTKDMISKAEIYIQNIYDFVEANSLEESEEEESEGKKGFKYKDPITNEIFQFDRKGLYKKNGRTLVPFED